MLNVGEQLVSSYLRHIRGCDFIQTNLYTIESQGEIDVVGVNLTEQQVYICEVAIHQLTDKFSRDIEYARKYLDQYKHHFMLWSPIVKDTKGKLENNQIRHLEEIKANIKARYEIDIECIVNQKFQECLIELRNHAKTVTKELQCPLMRLMQIEEYLSKYVKKLSSMKGHESASILTDEPIEEVVNGAVTMTGPALTTEFPLTGPEMRALRREVGLTQGDLAVALGMKRSSSAAIGDWEAERLKVPTKHHVKLLSLYKPANT